MVTVQLENRTISIASHAIDILVQNLEEIHTSEEKSLRRNRPHKFMPLDIHLNNTQLSLNVRSTIIPFISLRFSAFSLFMNIPQQKQRWK